MTQHTPFPFPPSWTFPLRLAFQRDRTDAVGALAIVHGDVARACGYCEQLKFFQRPVERWSKAFEDRTFRWLMGTGGVPLDVPGVYRIRHQHKGRYGENRLQARIRSKIRRMQEKM